jgi:hypothetical protein
MFTVRPAVHDDTAEILDLLENYHKSSNLSAIPFVRRDCAKVVTAFMASRSCYTKVAVRDGKITGVLFASLEPFFFNKNRSWASDLLFISNGGGSDLLKDFKCWAKAAGADQIIMGVSSENARADRLIELLGFKKTGGMHVFHCQSS